LALPLRRIGHEALLRRHPQPPRVPGRRGGGEEIALAARAGVRTFMPPAAIAGILFQVLAGPSVTADLDGSGVPSTARLVSSARGVELEVADGRGTRVASTLLPLDPSRISSAALSTGPLGSAGALVEVAYPGRPGTTCRRIYRFREASLSPLPLRGPSGVLRECDDAGWVSRWERPVLDAPALWVRERSLATADGLERDVEAYAFAGFDLAIVPERSRPDIRGVAIPAWPDPVFYPRNDLLQTLFPRADVARLRSRPRLRIVSNQVEHRFDLRVLRRGEELVFPVCRAARTGEDEVLLTGEARGRTVRVRVKLGGTEEKSPVEVAAEGLGPDVDGYYVPVLRYREGGFELYPTAEDELAL